MFGLFSMRRKQKDKEKAEDVNINSPILIKLDRIIELLEIQQKAENMRNIHFDTVQIDHLENIVFHLDNIEIDELSGKLIIGNNISASNDLAESLQMHMNSNDMKKETMSDQSSSNQDSIIKTSKGFRFHYDS
jgi:CCR4-NOT transcriptional regulation complex NOT5 subunit